MTWVQLATAFGFLCLAPLWGLCADIQFQTVLDNATGTTITLSASNRYVGGVYLGPEKPHFVVYANNAQIVLATNQSISLNGSRLTLENAQVSGSGNALFLVNGGARLTLRNSTVKASSGNNAIYGQNSTIQLSGTKISDSGFGVSATGMTVNVLGATTFEKNGTGILLNSGSRLNAANLDVPNLLTFKNNTNNGLLCSNSAISIANALFISNGFGISAGSSTVSLSGTTEFRANSIGFLASGGRVDVAGARFDRNLDTDAKYSGGAAGLFKNNYLTGSPIGVIVEGGAVVEITDNTLLDPVRRGIDVLSSGGQKGRATIRGNTITVSASRPDTNWETGINLLSAGECLIEFNTIERWRTGISVADTKATVRHNSVGFSRQPDAFGLLGQALSIINRADCTATRNFFYHTEGDNIFVSGGSKAVIRENLLIYSRENGVLVQEENMGAPLTTAEIVNNDIRNPTMGVALRGNCRATVAGNTIYVPFEDRPHADPSRGVFLDHARSGCLVEGNLIIAAPMTGVCVSQTDGSVVRGNTVLQSGRTGIEFSGTGSVQVHANLVCDSYENGVEIIQGTGHSISNNYLYGNFRRQLTVANEGNYYQIAFLQGAAAAVSQNSLDTNLARKTGLENPGGGTIDSRNNYWGAASGPQVNNNNTSGPGLLITGSNIQWNPFETAPPTKARVWKNLTIGSNYRQRFDDLDQSGARLELITTESVPDAAFSLSSFRNNPRAPVAPPPPTASFYQAALDHRIRHALKDDAFWVAFRTDDRTTSVYYYDTVGQKWTALLDKGYDSSARAVVAKVPAAAVPNTAFAVGSTVAAADKSILERLLGLPTAGPVTDVNLDGTLDVADLLR